MIIKLWIVAQNARRTTYRWAVTPRWHGSGSSLCGSAGELSTNDFVHKLKICLKELNETKIWLVIIAKVKCCRLLGCKS
jgi:hypothetical protein